MCQVSSSGRELEALRLKSGNASRRRRPPAARRPQTPVASRRGLLPDASRKCTVSETELIARMRLVSFNIKDEGTHFMSTRAEPWVER
ncbi:hypothetical protein EVAR_95088_1 [Eumeta japonica]|uniref:Uncharacterized protein n=1 Tax=Eumeta variegata TaxID=151549 RepID=A0A4C1W539_EUMVA|nr:hypothetical protein EVAR_95088_1 [Eumeta japonica]